MYGIGYAAVSTRPVQYGLHRDREDAGGTARDRSEERRDRDRDCRCRSARRGDGDRRFRAAGPGASHRAAQIVADRFGLEPQQITVNLELDTQKDGWSIAAGNYACRFGPICSTVADMAAVKVRDKIARIAAARLNVRPEEVEFAARPYLRARQSRQSVSFYRVAGEAHWSPGTLPPDVTPGLRETVQWTPPQLTPTTEDNQINSMAVYGFGFDFCGVEISRDTGEMRIDKYVSVHDCGTILNPGIAKGQIGGSFAYGINTALFEEFVYGPDGSFLSGTYADYIVATAHEMPALHSMHPER